jgi:hypothetical protein
MPPTRTVSLPIWEKRTDGPDKARSIAEGDYRDPDLILDLTGAQVYPVDAEPRAAEPDWDQGWELRWGDRDFVNVAPDRPINPNTRMTFKGKGQPPEIVRRAYLEGRVLYGMIVARDEQRHD